jgi:two-component system, chemotaxis family, response regulator WspF
MRVAIVNDLPLAVEALRRCLTAEPGFELAWVAVNGQEAVARCAADRPDLILMDLFMPVMGGVQAIQHIMSASPCAILVITASVHSSTQEVYAALSAGALDVLDTPNLTGQTACTGADRLRAKLRVMRTLVEVDARQSSRAAGVVVTKVSAPRPPGLGKAALVVLGASTGGPGVLVQLLSDLRALLKRSAVPLPAVVVVQHIDTAFSAGLADWLGERSGWPCVLAGDGDVPVAGTIHLAGRLGHLAMTARGTLVNREEPRDYPYRPSVDEFFLSCRHWPGMGVAALLTGMGSDGARGLKYLRDCRWLTLAQSPDTCAVVGMPQAAVQLNAVDRVLPPKELAQALHDRLLLENAP